MTASDLEREERVRELATEILLKVEVRKAYADVLLDHTLNRATLSSRSRSLLTELVYGTLRWRGTIDGRLTPLVSRSLEATDPFIRNVLRLALYQLLFLDKIPDYAAVNEAVQLAKSHSGGKASGFVNAILRKFLKQKNFSRKPISKGHLLADLSEQWSHPEWLVKRWIDCFGRAETQALMKANNEQPPLVLRANGCKGTPEALLQLFLSTRLDAAPTPWSPQGIVIRSRLPVRQLPGFQDGLFQVQSEASQLVVYLLDPQPGERTRAAWAAPGANATHIAELMGDRGEVVATDISEKGLQRISQNCERLGTKSVRPLQADVSSGSVGSLGQPFDRVLVDAPCSGFGTLREHPEIRWNRGPSDIDRLSRLQKKILARVAPLLKPGGVLVYSTCTLMEEENENVAQDFLQRHNEFVLENAAGYLPEKAKSMIRGSYFLALPHRHNSDGFFAARMRKVV